MVTGTLAKVLEEDSNNVGEQLPLESLNVFLDMWNAVNTGMGDYIFYRLVLPSGSQYDLRLSDLRKLREVVAAGLARDAAESTDTPRKRERRKPNLSEAVRTARRERLKEYWRKKRADAASLEGGAGDA